MKTSILKSLFFSMLMVALFSNCEKNNPAPPSGPGTEPGSILPTTASSMSAKINGETFNSPFVVSGYYFLDDENLSSSLIAVAYENANILLFQEVIILNIYIPPNKTLESTTYSFTDNDCDYSQVEDLCMSISYGKLLNNEDESIYGNSLQEGGSLQVAFSTINLQQEGGRLVGTFSGVLLDNDTGETVYNVTDGKFDLYLNE